MSQFAKTNVDTLYRILDTASPTGFDMFGRIVGYHYPTNAILFEVPGTIGHPWSVLKRQEDIYLTSISPNSTGWYVYESGIGNKVVPSVGVPSASPAIPVLKSGTVVIGAVTPYAYPMKIDMDLVLRDPAWHSMPTGNITKKKRNPGVA